MAEDYKAEKSDYSKNHLVSVGNDMADYFRRIALEQIEKNKKKFLEGKVQSE